MAISTPSPRNIRWYVDAAIAQAMSGSGLPVLVVAALVAAAVSSALASDETRSCSEPIIQGGFSTEPVGLVKENLFKARGTRADDPTGRSPSRDAPESVSACRRHGERSGTRHGDRLGTTTLQLPQWIWVLAGSVRGRAS